MCGNSRSQRATTRCDAVCEFNPSLQPSVVAVSPPSLPSALFELHGPTEGIQPPALQRGTSVAPEALPAVEMIIWFPSPCCGVITQMTKFLSAIKRYLHFLSNLCSRNQGPLTHCPLHPGSPCCAAARSRYPLRNGKGLGGPCFSRPTEKRELAKALPGRFSHSHVYSQTNGKPVSQPSQLQNIELHCAE